MSRTSAGVRSAVTSDGRFTPRLLHNTLKFNGSSSRVGLVQAFNWERTQAFSIELWIRPDTTATRVIIGKSLDSGTFRGWSFRHANRSLALLLRNDGGANALQVSATVLCHATWQHVAVTYDGSSLAAGCKMYVNGAEVALTVSLNALSATTITAAVASIGSRNSTDLWFQGAMADVYVYTDVMTANEVLLAFRDGIHPNDAVAHYDFSEQSGTAVGDSIGTAEGTGTNITWGTDGPLQVRTSAGTRVSV